MSYDTSNLANYVENNYNFTEVVSITKRMFPNMKYKNNRELLYKIRYINKNLSKMIASKNFNETRMRFI